MILRTAWSEIVIKRSPVLSKQWLVMFNLKLLCFWNIISSLVKHNYLVNCAVLKIICESGKWVRWIQLPRCRKSQRYRMARQSIELPIFMETESEVIMRIRFCGQPWKLLERVWTSTENGIELEAISSWSQGLYLHLVFPQIWEDWNKVLYYPICNNVGDTLIYQLIRS